MNRTKGKKRHNKTRMKGRKRKGKRKRRALHLPFVLLSFVFLLFHSTTTSQGLGLSGVFCLFCSSFTFHSCFHFFSLQWNGEERNNNKENTRKTQTMDSCLFLVVRSFHYNGVKNEMRNGSVNEKNKQEQNTKSYGLVPFCFLFFLLAFSWIHASFTIHYNSTKKPKENTPQKIPWDWWILVWGGMTTPDWLLETEVDLVKDWCD